MRVFAFLVLALQTTFSVRTELVVLPVTVTDARGHHVSGLTIDHFRVLDNGRPTTIATFQSGEVPITIGLVVDHSQSMRSKLPSVTAAASAFARLAHHDDEFFVVMFSNVVRRPRFSDGDPFTSDPTALDAALAARLPGGPTALYDAVADALRHLPLGTSPRKALIVITDGGDNASQLKYHEVRALARQSQAVIYGVGLVGANSQDENPEALKQLCRDSGGIAYFPTPNDVGTVFDQIALDLREQYTLSINAGAAIAGKSSHSLTVKALGVDGRPLKVRTRSGYDLHIEK